MPKLSEQLRADAVYHYERAANSNEPQVGSDSFAHATNCVKAAYALDTAETIIKRLLMRIQVDDSAAIDARKFLGQLNGGQHAKS